MATPSLTRPADAPPPLTDELTGALEGTTERDELVATAREHAPQAVRDALDAPREAEASATDDEGASVRWQRLEMDDGDGLRFVELTADSDRIYIRRGRTGNRPWESIAPEVEIKTLAGPVMAVRSVEKRIQNLQTKDYVLVDPVERPLPPRSTADERREGRAAKDAERQARFAELEPNLLRLFQAWHDAGFDPTATFTEEARRLDQKPGEVTEAFLQRARAILDVTFSRRVHVPSKEVDERIAGPALAAFYVDPVRVARLAESKLRGDLPKGHDGEAPTESSSRARSIQLFDASSRALVRFRRQR